jgi:hypothetical protein
MKVKLKKKELLHCDGKNVILAAAFFAFLVPKIDEKHGT